MSSNQRGQTLMELIVVISVSIIVIGGLVFAIISSLRNAQFSKNQAQATKLAQEGIEQVRSGRDRNQCISIPDSPDVKSWNGNSNNSSCQGAGGSIWDYRITGNTPVNQGPGLASAEVRCNTPANPPTTQESKCYFKVSSGGSLVNTGSYTSFPENCITEVECIPSNDSPVFRRVVTLSDEPKDNLYKVQKTVTVIVRWTDFSGVHESRLTTILRKI